MASIHGHPLVVTVVRCKIYSADWVSRNHPWYFCFEHGGNKFINTNTEGGINPTFPFPDKSVFSLIEGLRELNFVVWKKISGDLSYDDFMGSGKVQLDNVISQGYDNSSWSFGKGNNSRAGEIKLELRYANADPKKLSASSSAKMVSPGYHQQYTPYFAAPTPYPPRPPPMSPYSPYDMSAYPPYPPPPPSYSPYPPPWYSYSLPSYPPPHAQQTLPPATPTATPHHHGATSNVLQGVVMAASLSELASNLFQFFGT